MKCENCECKGIAGDLSRCPQCGHELAPGYATGGPVSAGAVTVLDEPGPAPFVVPQQLGPLVGEHGPEPVDLPSDSVVTLTPESTPPSEDEAPDDEGGGHDG